LPDEAESQTFHATQDSNGNITITRTSAHGGFGDTITFNNVDEMRANFIPLYQVDEIDQLIQKLASSGSVDFKAISK
jgi:hypothetical protein